MRFLLDSQVFVWMHEDPNRLPPNVADEIIKSSNQIFLSIVSIWELQIKIQLKRFAFNKSFDEVIEEELSTNNIEILSVTVSHIFGLKNLPLHHKDPFDRLLISQTLVENMTMVSSDRHFTQYQVDLLW